MAGFFSLGAASANPQQQQHQADLNPPQALIPPENWFQLRNEQELAASYRGTSTAFQLWHHQQQQADQERNCNNPTSTSLLGFGVGVGQTNNRRSDEQTTPLPMMMMMQGGGCSTDGRRGSISCQDCGNQAKKECLHMRCRTCCKSRGFACQTHVKSTWVPASKRREKQQHHQLQLKRIRQDDPNSTTAAAGSNSSLACGSSTRLAPSPSALAAGGGMEVELSGRMPPELRTAAVFKCVKVSPIDRGEEGLEQLAYQTSVTIGGHLFRGILYDQGPEDYHHQQSHYSTDVGSGHIRMSNAQLYPSFAVDTTNVYQATNGDPNSFPGAPVDSHFLS